MKCDNCKKEVAKFWRCEDSNLCLCKDCYVEHLTNWAKEQENKEFWEETNAKLAKSLQGQGGKEKCML